MTESYVFHNTVDESINTLLRKKAQVILLNEGDVLRKIRSRKKAQTVNKAHSGAEPRGRQSMSIH